MYYKQPNNMYYQQSPNNMNYRQPRSKKKTIVISVIISLIIILSAVFFLTPVRTVYTFISGIKDKDSDKVIECVEPEKAAVLRNVKNLLSDSLFSTLITSLSQGNSDSGKKYTDEMSVTDYHIKDVKFNYFNKTSSMVICLDITDRSGQTSTLSLSVNFIRIGSKWYIDSISDTSLQLN